MCVESGRDGEQGDREMKKYEKTWKKVKNEKLSLLTVVDTREIESWMEIEGK